MGLFDAFKKKVTEKAEEVNPLHGYLADANLPIENLQVVDANGTVTVTGVAQEGSASAKVVELLKAKGINSITNNISVADLTSLNIKYKVATNSSNLNCRKGPSTDDEIVGKLAKGTIVTLVQKHSDKWHKVKNDKTEGYCHTDYLEGITST